MSKKSQSPTTVTAATAEVNEQLQQQITQLEAQLAELRQSCDQKEEAYRRALADYQNLRRQSELEKQRLIQMAGLSLIEDLLPTLDHLELALKHGADPVVQMVRDEFWRVLKAHGLEPVPVEIGQEFDHQVMEAVDTQEGQPNQVVEVVQLGYQLRGKVIRHAKVIVGKNKK